ncbi:coagulation factor V [Hyla sarda]|uniref:coagulation factor V n=1 Tax=Hyla sarda TaxID=327740 RepID=UPI0024C28F89|nr:coagulation factor V [Hyla sarda]
MELHMHHPGVLVVTLLLGALAQITPYVTALDRDYYVAAVITDWDYSNGQGDSSEYVFKKILFREYEEGFQKEKPASKLLGILGPTLRAEVGDTLKVHFKNLASKPLTVHPQGISYGKHSEGTKYADGTYSIEKMDDFVMPGEIYTYNWEITEDLGPKETDPDCLTSSYYSMENPVQDVNSGLIGALLICKKGSLNDDGTQKNFNRNYVLMFGVFDESKSWQNVPATNLMYTVNGYVNGAIPAFTAYVDDRISWHILGLSSKPESFSIHFFENSLEQRHHRVSVISLASMASTTANMTVSQAGTWKISSLVEKHFEAGMHGHLTVESRDAPKHNTPKKSVFQTRYIKKWDYYVAAIEVDWDYASGTLENSEKTYCQHPFKKVVYKQYTDSTFTEKMDSPKELGMIGPVIRAQVRDTIMVVFKNMASQPHNIYPHGVSLQRFFKGYVPDGIGDETQNSTVMPGETATYFWTIPETDGPTKSDPLCLTRIYHSTVNIIKDLASGLLGTLLICKSMTLDTRGLQEKTDREQVAMFTVFDENKSWYYEHNKPKACNKVLNKDSKSLYNSYVINSINGNSYENAILGFCQSDVVHWHVSSVGLQDEAITLQLSGHTFRYKLGYGDMMTLFPMTGETISVEMNNEGVWIFGNYNSKVTTLRFRDAKCPEDYEYEEDEIFHEYPETISDTRVNFEEIETELDKEDLDYNDGWAEMLNIRSHKNSIGAIDESVNLTALAIEDMSESSNENRQVSVNSTQGNKSYSSESSEEDFLLKDVNKYSSKDDNLNTRNGSEGFNGTNGMQMVLLDQRDKLNQTEEDLDDWTQQHSTVTGPNSTVTEPNSTVTDRNSTVTGRNSTVTGPNSTVTGPNSTVTGPNSTVTGPNSTVTGPNNTDLESEPNDILPNDDHGSYSTLYLEESSIEEEDRKSIQLQSNGSEVSNLKKRYAEHDDGNSSSENVIEDAKNELQNSVTDNSDPQSGDIPISNDIFAVERPKNITELSQLDIDTSELTQQMDQNYDKTPVTSTYESKSDPGSGGNQVPTRASPSVVLTPTTTPDNAHIEMHTTTSVSSQNDINDVHDAELVDMFGRHIVEDIMKNIFLQEQSDETNSQENEELLFNKTVEKNLEEPQNQSITTTSNVIVEENNDNVKVRKKVYYKKMNTFENGQEKPLILVRRKKKIVKKIKEKRTAVNGHGYKKNETLYNEYMESNNSSHSDRGNGSFTPRGFSPRGHNPNSLNPRGFNPHERTSEIVIGVSRGEEGDYAEYDHDASFLINEGKNKPRHIIYEEPYRIETEDDVNRYTNPDRIVENFMRTSKGMKRNYYIAAEEVQWDYTGGSRRNQVNEKPIGERGQNVYRKVVFRQYLDNTFTKPDVEGEYEEHLGILGPVIRAEVEDAIQVTFKNLASQPYSIHAHGVSYEKSSEGYRYDDETKEWLKKDDIVQPQESYVYVWYATQQSGPESEGSACRTWAYHSGVNPEKDIHSGLIGPLIICRPGTLDKQSNRPVDAREFILLFMSFNEEKSWYYDRNSKKMCTDITEKSSDGMICPVFHAINGITYNLQGFNMYENELVRWHLLNMGGPKDIHVVNFHGQMMTERIKAEFQYPAYPLMPGTFATVEMKPPRAGIWLLDTEVAEYQQAGMQTVYNVAEKGCNFPLGLSSRIISDEQITASHYIDPWEPRLARLNNGGSYNAWSAHINKSSLPWIQVDLQKTFLISGIQTQGASKHLSWYYIKEFFIAYSKDKKKWNVYKGNSTAIHKVFDGNSDSSSIKENQFDPPIAARYFRLYPTRFNNQPALRMELFGCEIQGCSAPLGLENYKIKDEQITASSYKTPWFLSPWVPSLARLNKAGSINAWQAKSNNNQQWLQIDFLVKKKITGIMTQGATSLTSELYVKSYTVQYSDNGKNWKAYMDSSTSMEKIFKGNSNAQGYVKNEFDPPIFSQYLRIIPKSWNQSIVMRLEVYGCDL